jgi:hypothetical protein
MAFTIRLCPYCGGGISADGTSYYVCNECGKKTSRSRTNAKAFLLGKPYEAECSDIMTRMYADPKESLERISAMIESGEPNADFYFTRGIVLSVMGEDGKAFNDWKKGISCIEDLNNLDAYIMAISKQVMEIICTKEREFLAFKPIEYIDLLSTEFRLKSDVPCKGILYITIYRDFKMMMQSGNLDGDEDIYSSIIPKLLDKIIAYSRDFRTTVGIIEEILEDFHYNVETYAEDDNQWLHLCDMLKDAFLRLSDGFTEEQIVGVIRHWNDENMFELEYWADELMKSVSDKTILQALRRLSSSNSDNFDLDEAVEDYAKRFLLLIQKEPEPSE